jgi:copper chaperone CopZ
MLWIATLVVVAFALFPNYVGLILRNNDQTALEDDRLQFETLKVGGMTCEACATEIQRELAKVPGVKQASIRYAERIALVKFDPTSPPSQNALLEAVEKAGYKATFVAPSKVGAQTGASSPLTAKERSSTTGQDRQITLYVEGMSKIQGIT